MSINPAIWRKASRWSDPRLLWRIAPFPAKAFAVSLACWLALLGAWKLPWAETANNYRARRAEKEALIPLLADARRESLTFPQVVVSFPAHLGKAVYWDITVVSSNTSYAEGRPGWSVLWTNPERAEELQNKHARVLARVAALDRETVYLDYLGRP